MNHHHGKRILRYSLFVFFWLAILAGSYHPALAADRPDSRRAGAGQEQTVYFPLLIKSLPAWQALGGSGSGVGISGGETNADFSPSTAIGPDGFPYVSWADNVFGEIYVKRWDGAQWVEVGYGSATGNGISKSLDPSYLPTMVIGKDGTPYVIWVDWTSFYGSRVLVKRFDGSSWVMMGDGPINAQEELFTSAIRRPAIAIAPDGTVYAAWQEWLPGQIQIRKWNGSAWIGIGNWPAQTTITNEVEDDASPSLAVGPDGMLYLSWANRYLGKHVIYVRRWNGSAWEEVGAGSASGLGISQAEGESRSPFIAVSADNTPYIAWQAGDTQTLGRYIFARRWNGSAWEAVGAGSASGTGITPVSAELGALALSPDGSPYISWNVTGGANLFLSYWNGVQWVEVGTNAASGQGISTVEGQVVRSSVAIAPGGTPYVAWCGQPKLNDYRIYLKRYE